MLKFRDKAYNMYWPNKWFEMDYSKTKGHLNTNKYTYKVGHKVYTGPSAELRQHFKDGVAQYKTWKSLTR